VIGAACSKVHGTVYHTALLHINGGVGHLTVSRISSVADRPDVATLCIHIAGMVAAMTEGFRFILHLFGTI